MNTCRRPPGFLLPVAVSLVLACATGCHPEAPAGHSRHVQYVVGLSPFFAPQVSDDLFRSMMRLVLEDMPLNSSLWIYDAYHLQTVTQLAVPNNRAFESGRTRANQFSAQIRELKAFLTASSEPPVVTNLVFQNAVRLPQFMDFVGENLNQSNATVVAIVLGSPLYLDEKEPGFSMVDGYFPSDGHLLASREQSVYGRKGCGRALEGMVVHFGYLGDPWTSDLHRQKVGRFWNLFLREQGARLGSFTADLPTVFNAVRAGSPGSTRTERDEIDPTQTKVEMLRITRDVGMADWITRELPADHRMPPPTTWIGPMKIGIRWEGNIDLDLYAQATDSAERLFFQHTRVAEGYYFKDHRSSPDREYEFIEFTEPVDVRRVRAGVNFYEGEMRGGAQGEIRIEFQGRIYSGRFELPVEHGNQGREGPRQEAFWTDLPVLRTLGLR